jgi:hypothetical protein
MIIFASAPSQKAAFNSGLRSTGATRAGLPRRDSFAIGAAGGRWWFAEFDKDRDARREFARQNPGARFFEVCAESAAGLREVTDQIRQAVAIENRAEAERAAAAAAAVKRIDTGRPRHFGAALDT